MIIARTRNFKGITVVGLGEELAGALLGLIRSGQRGLPPDEADRLGLDVGAVVDLCDCCAWPREDGHSPDVSFRTEEFQITLRQL